MAEVVTDFLDTISAFAAVVVEDCFGFDVAVGQGAGDAFCIGIVKIEDGFDNLFVSNTRIFGHDFVNAFDDPFFPQQSGQTGEAFHAFLSGGREVGHGKCFCFCRL